MMITPNNINQNAKRPAASLSRNSAGISRSSSPASAPQAQQAGIQSANKGDKVLFAGNSSVAWKSVENPDDADLVVNALQEAGAKLSDTEAAKQQLQADGNLPCKKDFYFGVVRLKEGKPVVSGMAKELQPVADMLFANVPSGELRNKLQEGLPLVIRVAPKEDELKEKVLDQLTEEERAEIEREEAQKTLKAKSDPKKADEDEDDNPYKLFMDNVFLKTFSLKKQNGETLPAIAWPILQRIISSKNPMDQGSFGNSREVGDFAKKIQNLGLYELHIPSGVLPREVTEDLKQRFQPLQTRLSAYKLMQNHYLESIDLKEVALPMMTGVMVGGGGETALEMAHLEGNPYTGLIRTGLLVGVDVIDNMFAQIPNIYQHASKNGLTKDAKGITGNKSWGDYISRALKGDFKLNGELGPTIQDALSSAVLGAASGSLFALPAGNVLSNENESVLARAITGGLGAWGTSLSLPLKLQKDRNKMVESLNQMIDKGWIQAPKDKKQRQAFIQNMLLQEAMAGTGNSASLKAFGLVPLLSGGILALEQLGLPRKWAQRLYMSISPGAENLLSLALMMDRNYRTADRSMKAAETRILASGDKGFTKQDESFYAEQFSDKTAKFISNLATNPWSFYGILGTTLAGLYAYMIKQKLTGKHAEPSAKPPNSSAIRLGQANPAYGRFPARLSSPGSMAAGYYPPSPQQYPFAMQTVGNVYPQPISTPLRTAMPNTSFVRPPYMPSAPPSGNYSFPTPSYAMSSSFTGLNTPLQSPQQASMPYSANWPAFRS